MHTWLRPIGERDLDDFRAMAEAFHAEDGHPIDAKGEAAVLIFRLSEPGVRGWLLMYEGHTIGYAVAAAVGGTGADWDAEIEELYVIPNRRGLAASMLELVCRELTAQGVAVILVEVAPKDVAARCFFATQGFISQLPGYVLKKIPRSA